MATGEVKISDGVNSINFHPGASVKRMLEKASLYIHLFSNQSTPRFDDYKRAHDIFLVDAEFKDRFSEYQTLFNMVKELPNASSFTFTWGTETFTVVVKQLIAEIEPGAGTMRAIHCEMEVVTA